MEKKEKFVFRAAAASSRPAEKFVFRAEQEQENKTERSGFGQRRKKKKEADAPSLLEQINRELAAQDRIVKKTSLPQQEAEEAEIKAPPVVESDEEYWERRLAEHSARKAQRQAEEIRENKQAAEARSIQTEPDWLMKDFQFHTQAGCPDQLELIPESRNQCRKFRRITPESMRSEPSPWSEEKAPPDEEAAAWSEENIWSTTPDFTEGIERNFSDSEEEREEQTDSEPGQENQSGTGLKKRRKKVRTLKMATVTITLMLTVVMIVWGLSAIGLISANGAGSRTRKEWPAKVGNVLLEEPPQRIVSLSPMATQALLSMPLGGRLCGVSEHCPTGGKKIPTMGTPLLPRPIEILSVRADCVVYQFPLAQDVIDTLSATGTKLIQLPFPTDFRELKELYEQMGALLMGDKTGRAVGRAVAERMEDSLDRCAKITGKEKTALCLFDLSGMAATVDTAEWAVLGQVFRHPVPDCTNWMADEHIFKDESHDNDLNLIKTSDPDILFVSDEISEEELKEKLGDLRAVQNGCVVYYDSLSAQALSPSLIYDIVRGVQLLFPELQAPQPTITYAPGVG